MRHESGDNFQLTTDLLGEMAKSYINFSGNRSRELISGRQSRFLARTCSDHKKGFWMKHLYDPDAWVGADGDVGWQAPGRIFSVATASGVSIDFALPKLSAMGPVVGYEEEGPTYVG